jgi:hypothetical protein
MTAGPGMASSAKLAPTNSSSVDPSGIRRTA